MLKLFSYHATLTVDQYLTNKYLNEKLSLINEIMKLIYEKDQQLI